jgi:hypothetical protein
MNYSLIDAYKIEGRIRQLRLKVLDKVLGGQVEEETEIRIYNKILVGLQEIVWVPIWNEIGLYIKEQVKHGPF